MRILVTGKNGQIGGEFARVCGAAHDLILAGRTECDFASKASLRALVRTVQPAVIINAAAYTAVDRAEVERDLCFAVNAEAPRILAQEAAQLDALFVHYSSDYVFNGDKSGPYLESDPIHPLSVYGESKAAGEAAVAASGGRSVVLRTSWVYGAHGKNFLRTMLRLGAERSELRIVDDQVGAPTSATAIAMATLQLIKLAAAAMVPTGVYHMTASGSTSWCGFARAIFGLGGLPNPPRVEAITTSEYPAPARRPANSVLSNDKFAHAFGFRLPPWQQQLQQVMAQLQAIS